MSAAILAVQAAPGEKGFQNSGSIPCVSFIVLRKQGKENLMENDTVTGTISALNSLQLAQGEEALDTASKNTLAHKEFLAVIMKYAVSEYKGYSAAEIEKFIEKDTLSIDGTDVSTGRTNTKLEGTIAEFKVLNEKTSNFDILFKALNPVLSDFKITPAITVHLHVDVEPQKDYRPGYPLEKRGVYYLARAISSQLGAVTETTNYGALEKCYSIWICRDNIPEKEKGSVSFYSFSNTANTGIAKAPNKDYDLMEMVIIRLGKRKEKKEDYSEPEVVRFLNSFFFHQEPEKMIQEISEFVDFSQNVALLKGVTNMHGLAQSFFNDGKDEGIGIGELTGKIIAYYDDGKTIEDIAKKVAKTPKEVTTVLAEKGLIPETV